MKGLRKSAFLASALGAAVVTLCGLILYWTPLGDPWVNASYDYLFRFGNHSVTNDVVLILMDNAAFDDFHQERGTPWDRGLHAQLLNKLADDGCEMVVLDSFFRQARDPASDAALAEAMRRQKKVVLMAEQTRLTQPGVAAAEPLLPAKLFLDAAWTNWGVAWLAPDGGIVRKHWPFPSPGPYPSLPETAARLTGTRLSPEPKERWIRYYGEDGAWSRMSYGFALSRPKNYFRDKIVFIGTQPKTTLADGEPDEFSTPYTRWTDEAAGGVEILVAEYLNLTNQDWLERPAGWIEIVALALCGILVGGGLCRLKPLMALALSIAGFVAVFVCAICLSHFTAFWFPWLIVGAAQLPLGLVCAIALQPRPAKQTDDATALLEPAPETPGYTLIHPPFGEGAYGKVWLARNRAGEWRALKVVYRKSFGDDPDPYDREFKGITLYKSISGQHPGLLAVEFVSEKHPEYFYYVMELGDSTVLDWESNPTAYRPRDLVRDRAQLRGRRLPVAECVQVGLHLTEALDFLHRQGLTHRDIKPQNVIFVNGQPKLADLGLIAEIRPADQVKTYVGTPGYMPPPPEKPGTAEADIYSLGMVLYVLSTGRQAAFFPEIATTLVESQDPAEFLPLNAIILKACQPMPADRYASAGEMRRALIELERNYADSPKNEK